MSEERIIIPERRFSQCYDYIDAILWAYTNEVKSLFFPDRRLSYNVSDFNECVERRLGCDRPGQGFREIHGTERSSFEFIMANIYLWEQELWGPDFENYFDFRTVHSFTAESPVRVVQYFKFITMYYIIERLFKTVSKHCRYTTDDEVCSHPRLLKQIRPNGRAAELTRLILFPFCISGNTAGFKYPLEKIDEHRNFDWRDNWRGVHYIDIINNAFPSTRHRLVKNKYIQPRERISLTVFDCLYRYSESIRYRIAIPPEFHKKEPFRWNQRCRWFGSLLILEFEILLYISMPRFLESIWDSFIGNASDFQDGFIKRIQGHRWQKIKEALSNRF